MKIVITNIIQTLRDRVMPFGEKKSYQHQRNLLLERELFRYLVCGVGAAVINYCFFLLFTEVFCIHYFFAMAFALLITWIYSFFVNKIFVFKAKTGRTIQEWLLFVLQQTILFLFSAFLMWVAVDVLTISKWLAWLVVAGVVTILNFTGMKFFIWRKRNANL